MGFIPRPRAFFLSGNYWTYCSAEDFLVKTAVVLAVIVVVAWLAYKINKR